MKKITLTALLLSSFLFAEDGESTLKEKTYEAIDELKTSLQEEDSYKIILDYKYTTVYLNPIEKQVSDTGSGVKVASTQTDDINILTAGIVLFPKTYHLALTYSSSFNGGAKEENTTINNTDEGVEQFTIGLRPTKNIEFVYDKYKLNSYLKVFNSEKLIVVTPNNTSAITGNLSASDTGTHILNGGDTATLAVIKDRFDLKYYSEETTLFDAKYYTGIYYEKFQKPWTSGFEVWYNRNNINDKIAVLYSEAVFTNYGLTTGVKKEFKDLKSGLNLKKLTGSLGLLDIQLTDNFNLSDRTAEQSNQQGIKATFATELSYKQVFTKKSFLVFSTFFNYDYYYIDLGRTNTSYSPTGDYVYNLKGGDLTLSDDYTYGFSLTYIF